MAAVTSDEGEVESPVGVERSDHRSSTAVTGQSFRIESGDLRGSANLLRDGLTIGQPTVDRREHHRYCLAVVGVSSPVPAKCGSFGLLLGATLAEVGGRDGREIVDALGPGCLR